MTESRVIKKYPNRRLYDTERSCYVTVDDVRDLVLKGVSFKVVDAETNEDITRNILIQIITEQESGKKATFTTEMLAQLIRLSHDAAQQTFSSYLDQSMRMFREQQQFLQDQMQEALSGKTLAEMTRRNLELWQRMQESFLKATGIAPPKPKSDRRTKTPRETK
ncbi:MAG: polyhydroxyalkanoate synthesis repressor PhaR [Sulfurifustaceae bacterium]